MGSSIAIVLFPDLPEVDLVQLQAELSRRWPELGRPQNLVATEADAAFSLGRAVVVLGSMWVPMPELELERVDPVQPLWPDHAVDLHGHESHLIIHLDAPETVRTERLGTLAKITSAVLDASPEALGVFWCLPTQLVAAGTFQTLEAGAEGSVPPALLSGPHSTSPTIDLDEADSLNERLFGDLTFDLTEHGTDVAVNLRLDRIERLDEQAIRPGSSPAITLTSFGLFGMPRPTLDGRGTPFLLADGELDIQGSDDATFERAPDALLDRDDGRRSS